MGGRHARVDDLPSPPPHHNFDVIPTVIRGPHEFANPEVKKALGRDDLNEVEEFSSDNSPKSRKKPEPPGNRDAFVRTPWVRSSITAPLMRADSGPLQFE